MPIHVFRAGANGVSSQSGIPAKQYTRIQATTQFKFNNVSGIDTGNEWDNVAYQWTPQAGPVDWQAQVWALDFGDPTMQNYNLCLTIFKNGIDWLAGIGGQPINTFPSAGNAICCGSDVASGTDVYSFNIYMTTVDGQASGFLNADPRHIWICGKSYGQ